jgi:hypothetical protein
VPVGCGEDDVPLSGLPRHGRTEARQKGREGRIVDRDGDLAADELRVREDQARPGKPVARQIGGKRTPRQEGDEEGGC